jgi:hypothetical protein
MLNVRNIKCEIVPTPVQDKAYCGVCLEIDEQSEESATDILTDLKYKASK